jgi:glycosyltransferase involved in cell wall biosynthesis
MTAGDRVIAVSRRILEYILTNYPSTDPARISLIHGGIDPAAFPFGHRPDPAWIAAAQDEFPELVGKRVLCLPGRLSRYKGHVEFIELLQALKDDYPDLHGIIVGAAKPGSRYRDELAGLTYRYGIADRITFTGTRLDIRDWMAMSEIVFSLCSDPPEAFGRTVPEALHLGIPVIGWNHGGVGEVLERMFPAGAVGPDDNVALELRTRAFLDHPPRLAPSDEFGLNESMARTLALYLSLRSVNVR